jgi:hypothetical protein
MLTLLVGLALLSPKGAPDGDDAYFGTYSLHIGAESRAICRLLDLTDLSMRYTLHPDHTYLMEKVVNGKKTGETGRFRIDGEVLSLTADDSAPDGQDRPKAAISKDHIHIGDLDFARALADLSGLWVHVKANGKKDGSLRFRFNDKGHFWFVASGDPPSTSEGAYEIVDGMILLHYTKVDGKSVEDQGYGTGKLPLGEDGISFSGAFGGRFERSTDDK